MGVPAVTQNVTSESLLPQVLRQHAIVVLHQGLVPEGHRAIAFHLGSIANELLDTRLESGQSDSKALIVLNRWSEESAGPR